MTEPRQIDEQQLIGLTQKGVKLYVDMRKVFLSPEIWVETQDPERKLIPVKTRRTERRFDALWSKVRLERSWESVQTLTELAVEPMLLRDLTQRLQRTAGTFPLRPNYTVEEFLGAGLVTQDPKETWVANPPIMYLQPSWGKQ